MDIFLAALAIVVALVVVWIVYTVLRAKLVFTYGTAKQQHAYLLNVLEDSLRKCVRPPEFVIAYFAEDATKEWASEVGVDYPDEMEEFIAEQKLPRLPRGLVCLKEPHKSMFCNL